MASPSCLNKFQLKSESVGQMGEENDAFVDDDTNKEGNENRKSFVIDFVDQNPKKTSLQDAFRKYRRKKQVTLGLRCPVNSVFHKLGASHESTTKPPEHTPTPLPCVRAW